MMDWSNEEYVRLYIRETADDLELSWEAVALWRALLCKFDRAGRVAARNGWASLSALTRIPTDVCKRVGPELVRDGRLKHVPGGFYAPNFTDAQTASKSCKLRQRDSRDKRRKEAASQVIDTTNTCHEQSQVVTSGHEASQDVTLALAVTSAEPSLSQCDAEAIRQPVAPADEPPPGGFGDLTEKVDAAGGDVGAFRAAEILDKRANEGKGKRRHHIPDGWKPARSTANLAAEYAAKARGVDLRVEVAKLVDWAIGGGIKKADWDATWRNWTRTAKATAGTTPSRSQQQFELQQQRIAELEAEESEQEGAA